jgi:uncharacterized coiled-coil protein SlyX
VAAFFASFVTAGTEDTGEVIIPETAPVRTREEIEAASSGVTDRLFGGDDDEPEPPKPPDKKDQDPPPKKKGEGKDADEDQDPDDDADPDNTGDGGVIDFEDDDDADLDDKDGGQDEGEGNDDADPAIRETKAQADAKKYGRLVKELETDLTSERLEKARIEEELKVAKERLAEFSQVTIDPRSVPAFKKLNDEMWADVDLAVAEELPSSAAGLADRFTPYMKSYLLATRLSGPDRAKAIAALKASIVGDLGGFDDPYEELLDDDLKAADILAKDVLAVIRRNADRAGEMITLQTEIQEKSKLGRLVHGAKEYERTRSSLKPLVEGLGKMEDKLIEENPYSPEAVVAQLVKQSPKLAKKLEEAKDSVLDIMLGERPLIDTEYKNLEEQGVNIKEFLSERSRKFEEKRGKLIPLLVRGLFTAGITKKALESLIKEQREAAEKKDEVDVLTDIERRRQRRPKATDLEEKKKKEIPPHERPNPLDKIFGPPV